MKKVRIVGVMMALVLLVGLMRPIQVNAAVKISATQKTMYVGDTLELKITGTNKKVTWSSSKKSVAAVSAAGKVTAKKAGTATITAEYGNKKKTCKITVKASRDLEWTDAANAKVGDVVEFGSYEQDNDTSNGKEAIEWYVLDKKDGKLLLLSKYILDVKEYNRSWKNVTWETCTLRNWLNDDFYTGAFTKSERDCISKTTMENEDNPVYGTDGGNKTTDSVFLLSLSEAKKYFGYREGLLDYYWNYSGDERLLAKTTAYVRANGGAYYYDPFYNKYDYNGYWGLRSPGINRGYAAFVTYSGEAHLSGTFVNKLSILVRPALWVEQSTAAVKISATQKTMYVGDTLELKITGTNKKVTWSSSENSVAAVSAAGKVTAKKAGTATITAKYGNKEKNCKITVKASRELKWTDAANAKVGDVVKLGSYEQDNDTSNGKEAIEWYVLDKKDGKLLLLSKYILDVKQYNETHTSVTWETCTLRSWLNDDFYTGAFTKSERDCISETKLENWDNLKYGFADGGNNTTDSVFLLSPWDAEKYFGFTDDDDDEHFDFGINSSGVSLLAKTTAYARANGAWYSGESGYENNGNWWLRSPGISTYEAADVSYYGTVGPGCPYVDKWEGVRPALWVAVE